MVKLKTQVVNEDGLYMRLSMKLVDIANLYESNITISNNKIEANARSIIEIATLVACQGTLLTITAEGTDEKKAAEHIKNFIEKDCAIIREKHYDPTRYKRTNR